MITRDLINGLFMLSKALVQKLELIKMRGKKTLMGTYLSCWRLGLNVKLGLKMEEKIWDFCMNVLKMFIYFINA